MASTKRPRRFGFVVTDLEKAIRNDFYIQELFTELSAPSSIFLEAFYDDEIGGCGIMCTPNYRPTPNAILLALKTINAGKTQKLLAPVGSISQNFHFIFWPQDVRFDDTVFGRAYRRQRPRHHYMDLQTHRQNQYDQNSLGNRDDCKAVLEGKVLSVMAKMIGSSTNVQTTIPPLESHFANFVGLPRASETPLEMPALLEGLDDSPEPIPPSPMPPCGCFRPISGLDTAAGSSAPKDARRGKGELRKFALSFFLPRSLCGESARSAWILTLMKDLHSELNYRLKNADAFPDNINNVKQRWRMVCSCVKNKKVQVRGVVKAIDRIEEKYSTPRLFQEIATFPLGDPRVESWTRSLITTETPPSADDASPPPMLESFETSVTGRTWSANNQPGFFIRERFADSPASF